MHFRSLPLLMALAAAGCVSSAAWAQPAPKTMDVTGFIAEIDRNHDGCASKAEWQRAGAPMSSYNMLKDERGCVTVERMNQTAAPDGIDTNGDGKLTLAEMKAFDKKMAPLMAKMKNAPKTDKPAEALQIQNLMSRRMFYHSVGRNELELGLWSKTRASEIRWAQNQGCWVGMASLKVYYDDVNRLMQAAQLKTMSEKNPAIKNVPENRYIGNMVLHTLTTPIIEVADDGQSAKGVWYTPGAILTTKADASTPEGIWMWERYGVDFIKEDGHWAILHAQVNTDFGNPMGMALQRQGADAAVMGAEGAGPGPGAAGLKIPGPDVAKPTYQEFSATRVPRLEPRLPEPYRSANETFEYADCSDSARGH
jgi:hypothetical protein